MAEPLQLRQCPSGTHGCRRRGPRLPAVLVDVEAPEIAGEVASERGHAERARTAYGAVAVELDEAPAVPDGRRGQGERRPRILTDAVTPEVLCTSATKSEHVIHGCPPKSRRRGEGAPGSDGRGRVGQTLVLAEPRDAARGEEGRRLRAGECIVATVEEIRERASRADRRRSEAHGGPRIRGDVEGDDLPRAITDEDVERALLSDVRRGDGAPRSHPCVRVDSRQAENERDHQPAQACPFHGISFLRPSGRAGCSTP